MENLPKNPAESFAANNVNIWRQEQQRQHEQEASVLSIHFLVCL